MINNLATGGAQSLVVNLSIEMTRLGHSSRIFTFAPTPGNALVRAQENGLDVITLGHFARDARAISKLSRAVVGSDVIHVHLFPALYFVALARLSNPLIYTEHSTTNRRRSVRMLSPLEKAAYGGYDKIVAISDGVREGLQHHFNSIGLDRNIEVIQNGIGAGFFNASPRVLPRGRGPLRIIAIGTLDARKNFAAAVAAVHRVPNVTLSIAGGGPQVDQLRRQIQQLGLGDRVFLLGERADVRELLDQHHVLLSTSLFEGFGLVVAEAMARGCAVIGPAVPGLDEVVINEKSGLLYPQSADALDEIAARIARVRDNEPLYDTLAHAAFTTSRRFSIGKAAAAYLDLYENLL